MDREDFLIAIEAVRNSLSMVWPERILALICSACAIVLLVYCAVLLTHSPHFTYETAGYFLGSGGLFTATGARIFYITEPRLKLIDELIRRLAGLQVKP